MSAILLYSLDTVILLAFFHKYKFSIKINNTEMFLLDQILSLIN